MSHRRKNSHPTMKNKRISAPNGEDTSLSENYIQSDKEENGEDQREKSEDRDKALITIPSDLADDFEKLKNITKLDTHALMRNLLKDYQRLSEEATKKQDGPPPDIEVRSIGSEDSNEKAKTNDTTRDSADERESESVLVGESGDISLAYRKDESPEKKHVEISFDEPLDLSVMKDEYNNDNADGISPQPSQLIPNTVFNITDNRENEESRSPAADTKHVQPEPAKNGTESPLRVAAPFDISKMLTSQFDFSKMMQVDPTKFGQPPPELAKMDLSKISASFIPLSLPQTSGCSMVFYPFPVTSSSVSSSNQTSPSGGIQGITTNAVRPHAEQTTTVASPVPIQPATVEQIQKRHEQEKRGHVKVERRKEVSIGSRSKQNKTTNSPKTGNMRVVYENTTLPGVYTSILKLPWSRRSRHKVHPPAHGHKNMHCEQPPSGAQSKGTSQLFLSTTPKDPAFLGQPEHEIRPNKSAAEDAMMTVYRTSSMEQSDRPKRRGRPPKLPVLANLLADKHSKSSRDQNGIATGPQSGDYFSHNGPSMVQTRPEILKNDPMISHASPIQSFMQNPSRENSPYHISDASSPRHTPIHDTPQPAKEGFNFGKQPGIGRPENGSSNAEGMYHEMVLSSKSLVNAKPRKRNLPSDLLKPNDNFLCTSFRFRPRKRRSNADDKVQYAQQAASFMEPLSDVTPPKGSRDQEEAQDGSNNDARLASQINKSKKPRHMFHELFHCKICNDIISGEDKSDHEKLHLGKLLICQNCEDEFECSNVDESSIIDQCLCPKCKTLEDQGSVKRPARGVVCDLCQERMRTYFEYCIHLERVHEIAINFEDEHYVCNMCGKVTYSEEDREAHQKVHSGCEMECTFKNCEERFSSNSDLERHILEDHETDKDWECVYDGCDEHFERNADLQDHIRQKHSNGYHCPWPGCAMEFTTHRALKIHTLIHTDEKPLKCDFCDYRCRQRNALNWHMRKHPEASFRYTKFSMMTQDA